MQQVLESVANSHRRSIGQLLLDGGLVSQRSLRAALEEQQQSAAPLGEILLRMDCLGSMERDAVLNLQRQLDAGELTINNESARCQIGHLQLGKLLTDNSVLSIDVVESALSESQIQCRRLGEVLVDRKLLTKRLLAKWLRLQQNLVVAATAALLAISAPSVASIKSQPLPTKLAEFGAPDKGAGHISDDIARSIGYPKTQAMFGLSNLGNRVVPESLGLRNFQKDHVRRLSPTVMANAIRFDIPAGLVMAVIHTESSFNVKAYSTAQAIGLMQIVPKSAGVSVKEALHGNKEAPSNAELLNPEVNIEFGAAYLSLLKHRYLKFIPDLAIREVAVIAAYNWGPTRIRAMLRRNGMPESVEDMVELISQHAPKETRGYLQRVTSRKALYTAYFAETTRTHLKSI
jgi:hypothetical protein